MDNLGTEVSRFIVSYKSAIESQLHGIQETLRTDDAYTLKATLIESGILERGIARERKALERIQRQDSASKTLQEAATERAASDQKPVLPSLGRLQAAVEMLLGTNHHLLPSASTDSYSTANALSPSSSTTMMSTEQRSIVNLRLQLLFEDINKAVEKLHVATQDGVDGVRGSSEDESDGEDDDYQVLRHHIHPSGVEGFTATDSHQRNQPLSVKGTAASEASASRLHDISEKKNRKTSKGPFRSLKSKSLLPSEVSDLRVLCEDLHEKEFTAVQKLRVSEAQKEELLFRLNAREETLRGLRTHFLREIVETVGTANASGGGGGGGGGGANSSSTAAHVTAAARFAGIPITFIEECDIEVARKIANAQLQLEQIRSDHGKELWRQREGWAKRLESKEKELIQMQIMFRNALTALQGKHASVVSKIVDENSNLKNTNVQVEHMALQRAEAFFEMKLNEKIAQLTSQYEGKLSLLEDKLAAANQAFRQSLSELKSERRERRRVDKQLQEAERLLDHALLIEIPFESERASKGLAAELALLQKTNEELVTAIARSDAEREEEKEKWEAELQRLREALESSKGDNQALEMRLSAAQNDLNQMRNAKQRIQSELSEKELQLRSAQNELVILKDKMKSKFSLDASANDILAEDEREALALLQLQQQKVDELQKALENAKAEITNLTNELAALKKDRDTVTKDSTAMLKRLLESEQELRNIRESGKDKDSQVNDYKDRYDAANSKCDEYRDVIAQLQRELEDRERELAGLLGGNGVNTSNDRPSSRAPSSLRFVELNAGENASMMSGRASPLGPNTATPTHHNNTNANSMNGELPPPSRASSRSNVFRIQPPMVSIETNTSISALDFTRFGSPKMTSDIGIQLSAYNNRAGDLLGSSDEELLQQLLNDLPTNFLATERQLNANLRRQLADLNAQLRIVSKEQVLHSCGTVEAIRAAMGTPYSNIKAKQTSKRNSLKPLGVDTTTTTVDIPSQPATTVTSRRASASAFGTPSIGTDFGASTETAAPPDPLLEMLPIPFPQVDKINRQNTLFQSEIDRRVTLLADAIQFEVDNANYFAEQQQYSLLMQQRESASRSHHLPPQHPSSSRPQSAHVRYSIGALPMSRLGASTGSRDGTPTRVGAGFVISHRPNSGRILQNSSVTHPQKGRAPFRSHSDVHGGPGGSLADMDVYEDEVDETMDEEGLATSEGTKRGRLNHAQHGGDGKGNSANFNTSSIPIVEPLYDDETNVGEFYDANGLPKYVWGIDKRAQLLDGSFQANARTTGGAVKGRMTPKAPLAPNTPKPLSAHSPQTEGIDVLGCASSASHADGRHRYIIQPQSFFTVRNRLLNGAPDQQRWEMSSTQIRKAAGKGLCRGNSATRRADSGADSPRNRVLSPAEDGSPRNVVFATNMVQSLSRPATAGPIRPPTVLEVSDAANGR